MKTESKHSRCRTYSVPKNNYAILWCCHFFLGGADICILAVSCVHSEGLLRWSTRLVCCSTSTLRQLCTVSTTWACDEKDGIRKTFFKLHRVLYSRNVMIYFLQKLKKQGYSAVPCHTCAQSACRSILELLGLVICSLVKKKIHHSDSSRISLIVFISISEPPVG